MAKSGGVFSPTLKDVKSPQSKADIAPPVTRYLGNEWLAIFFSLDSFELIAFLRQDFVNRLVA